MVDITKVLGKTNRVVLKQEEGFMVTRLKPKRMEGSMRFVLKGDYVLRMARVDNPHQLALKAQVSQPTIQKYIVHSKDVKQIDTAVMAALLMRGLEMTREEILNMKIGELFDLVPEK